MSSPISVNIFFFLASFWENSSCLPRSFFSALVSSQEEETKASEQVFKRNLQVFILITTQFLGKEKYLDIWKTAEHKIQVDISGNSGNLYYPGLLLEWGPLAAR